MPKLDAARRAAGNGAAGLVLLAVLGCSKPDFTVKLEAPALGEFTRYKLGVEGVPVVPVAPLTTKHPYQSVAPGHRGSKPKDRLPHVEASVLSVCGWQPAKVEMYPPSEYEFEHAPKE